MAKWRLGSLLEEAAAYLRQEGWDLVLVILLLEARVVEDEQLCRPCQRQQVAAEDARLLLLTYRTRLATLNDRPRQHTPRPSQHGVEAEYWRSERHAPNHVADQRKEELLERVL